MHDGAGSGWAFDPDSAGTNMPVGINVECPTAGAFNVYHDEATLTDVHTSDDRADVRAAFPQYPVGTAGFHFTVPNPERFRGRGCEIRAYAQDQQGNPRGLAYLQTKDTATLNLYTLPFD